MFDYLIVGAGFAGAVVAERLAVIVGKKVLLSGKRNNIAGNSYDFYHEARILIHYTKAQMYLIILPSLKPIETNEKSF